MTSLSTDTGGTFTDFVLLSRGRITTFKVPSTPTSPDKAIAKGIARIDGKVDVFVHGTTVGTNLVLERKGARTALVSTMGFRDLIEIGRQTRPSLYEPVPKPEPLVPNDLRMEVLERIGPDGEVISHLRRKEVRRIVREVRESGADSVAVSLLFSFMDPCHEIELGKTLRKLGLAVSLSSEVLPVFREYERTSTTVMDAYVKPRMTGYIKGIEALLPKSKLMIMQSNGGVARPSIINRRPVTTLYSGPAGGVAAALHLGRVLGLTEMITFDMGGTSTDVSTIVNGNIQFRPGTEVGGLPVNVPMVDIVSVGAGGGSQIWLDEVGGLKVGPESAGADPGPICYGRGGNVPTVTDCALIAGLIDPENFLGGRMKLDLDKAKGAIRNLAKKAGLKVKELLQGAMEVVNSHMGRAVRYVTVERGLDPATFTLVAFGGAGPMHACMLARELGIRKVLVPDSAGVFSALGLLLADTRMDYHRTHLLDPSVRGAARTVKEVFKDLDRQAKDELEEQGISARKAQFSRSLDLRYKGQSFEVNVPFKGKVGDVVKDFHAKHERLFTYCLKDRPTEIVNIRLTATHRAKPILKMDRKGKGSGDPTSTRTALLDRPRRTNVHRWSDLRPGHSGKGPSIIEEDGSTTVVPPGFSWNMDQQGNLELEDGDGR